MPVDFPDTPVLNDTYTVDSRTWMWNGVAWKLVTSSVGPTGPTGPAGYQGSDGATGPAGDDGRFFTGATPPMTPAPEEGDAWFNSNTSRLYVYYDSYWVEASAPVAGPTGPAGVDGATGPAGPSGELTRSIRTVSTNTTLLLNDKNNIVAFTGSSLQTLTLANVLEPGSSVKVLQLGNGQVRLSPDTGVSLSSSNSLFGTSGQNTQLEVLCTSSGQYLVLGETSSVVLATGGTITSSGNYVYHTFTSNGTFTPVASLSSVDYLVVAGGGGGGIDQGGGGGAGGYISGTFSANAQPYTITVGAGGAGAPNTGSTGLQGSSSQIVSISTLAIGGGGGGSLNTSTRNGSSGGSGGGGAAAWTIGGAGSGGSGTSGQGNSGASGSTGSSTSGGGGGGGSGSAGTAGGSSGSSNGGNGGLGTQWLNGNYYAAGGGGGTYQGSIPGSGGSSIGGTGLGPGSSTPASYTIHNGVINTGSGGGGGLGNSTVVPGSGSSGVVIVRYSV